MRCSEPRVRARVRAAGECRGARERDAHDPPPRCRLADRAPRWGRTRDPAHDQRRIRDRSSEPARGDVPMARDRSPARNRPAAGSRRTKTAERDVGACRQPGLEHVRSHRGGVRRSCPLHGWFCPDGRHQRAPASRRRPSVAPLQPAAPRGVPRRLARQKHHRPLPRTGARQPRRTLPFERLPARRLRGPRDVVGGAHPECVRRLPRDSCTAHGARAPAAGAGT